VLHREKSQGGQDPSPKEGVLLTGGWGGKTRESLKTCERWTGGEKNKDHVMSTSKCLSDQIKGGKVTVLKQVGFLTSGEKGGKIAEEGNRRKNKERNSGRFEGG